MHLNVTENYSVVDPDLEIFIFLIVLFKEKNNFLIIAFLWKTARLAEGREVITPLPHESGPIVYGVPVRV